MKGAPALVLLIGVLAACTPTGATIQPGGSATETVSHEVTVSVSGRATAGPVCPVESMSPDPSCAPRPVAGAELILVDEDGTTVATLRTDADGRFSAELPPGAYRIEPQPMDGILGTAPAIDFELRSGSPVELDVAYDTGIR